jgi:hypothetical protein
VAAVGFGPVRVCVLWVACHGKSELLTTWLPCLATMTQGGVPCLCSAASRGVVSPQVSFLAARLANLLVHIYSFDLIERQSSCLCFNNNNNNNNNIAFCPKQVEVG